MIVDAHSKKIGMALIIIAVIVGMFGYWIKSYNDKVAQEQMSQTGKCYLSDGTCIHETSNMIFYTSSVISTVIAVVGLYLLFRKNRIQKVIVRKVVEKPTEKKPEEIKAPATLSSEMRQVFGIIAQSGGAILQGEIVAKSGMDKVKVSRILDKLEMQGLVERRRHGMSNMIVLKKK